jgi:hypothetical protein
MADEFSLSGSFDTSSYVPFDSEFGALASSSVGSLIPSLAATGTVPVATSTASTSSPTTTVASSSGFGGVIANALNKAVDWGGQVLALDVFNRAQTTGATTSTQQTTSTDTVSGTGITGTTGTIAGVPSWLVYGGAGLLLLLLLLKFGK